MHRERAKGVCGRGWGETQPFRSLPGGGYGEPKRCGQGGGGGAGAAGRALDLD